MSAPDPTSAFATVNGIRLHYLDWGGKGPALIFLAGMGSTAYIFNKFAPRFCDRFRVLALTRRGHGDSEYPETGYDADTLTEDIRRFMDHVQVDKAVLAGHSLAGVELTHFAATHPDRVEKLVYLEALDDRRGETEILKRNPLRNVDIKRQAGIPHSLEEYIADLKRSNPGLAKIWSGLWDEEISHGVTINAAGVCVDRMPASVEKMMVENLVHGYAPKTVAAKIPTLAFYAWKTPTPSDAYTREQKAALHEFERSVAKPYFRSLISEFHGRFPHAQIVEVPDGHHYCFIAQEQLVYREMRKFLLA